MCGILGIINKNPDNPAISIEEAVNMLEQLQYRGCDSHGYLIRYHDSDKPTVARYLGKISEKEKRIAKAYSENGSFKLFLGHTRWSTTSYPSISDCQPLFSEKHGRYIVHNGHVENKDEFGLGEYDTRVISETIIGGRLYNKLRGNNIFVLNYNYDPDGLFILNKSILPIYITETDDYVIVTSDPIVIPTLNYKAYNNCIITVSSEYIEILQKSSYSSKEITNNNIKHINKKVDNIEFNMLNEIKEQPEKIRNIDYEKFQNFAKDCKITDIVGCGSSYHAAKYLEACLFSVNSTEDVKVQYASDAQFAYTTYFRNLLVLSQSGSTLDTIKAIGKFKQAEPGGNVFGIVNKDCTPIEYLSLGTLNINFGPEIGVAATKSFTGTILALLLNYKLINKEDCENLILPMEKTIYDYNNKIEENGIFHAANLITNAKRIMVIGGGIYYPIAQEIVLKLQEVCQKDAYAIRAGEAKHGLLALVNEDTLAISFKDFDQQDYSQILTNIDEIKCRGGKVTSIIPHESLHNFLKPIGINMLMQLIVYQTAVNLDIDPDYCKNLCKSVTV